jgi:hypothetical protein
MLHQHRRDCKAKLAKKTTITSIEANHDEIITFVAHHDVMEVVYSEMSPDEAQGLGFRSCIRDMGDNCPAWLFDFHWLVQCYPLLGQSDRKLAY